VAMSEQEKYYKEQNAATARKKAENRAHEKSIKKDKKEAEKKREKQDAWQYKNPYP